MEKIFEMAAELNCVNHKCSVVGKWITSDTSPENCLKLCIASSKCLGVSVGRWPGNSYGDCNFITQTPKRGWDTADFFGFGYDMWRKKANIGNTSA